MTMLVMKKALFLAGIAALSVLSASPAHRFSPDEIAR